MALDDALDARFEAFEARTEDKLRALFHKFKIDRSKSPNKSQLEKVLIIRRTDLRSVIKGRVGFPRWEDRDPTCWISRAERFFRFHRNPEGSKVDIAAIQLEGDAIQWYDWFVHTYGVPTWEQFKSGLDHCCKRGKLLMIEPIEEREAEDMDPEVEEEDTEEEAEPITSMVAARLTYRIEDFDKFDVKVADGRILAYNNKCQGVKLIM
ncbi:hypothetical protein BHM03_00040580 [Ensete ventricosum]|nr:hypothetical protein BHM03_00040580 [Ensete ventricosum]